MRILKIHPLGKLINHIVIDLPTPSNISYWWNTGSLLGITLILQILTGIFLAIHYVSNTELAFNSLEHIIRDVNNGWIIRYVHANGASLFFALVYFHIGRGLYYGSYNKPRLLLWNIGILIYFTIIATAFIGYVLPWGQISLWGANVITNLFTTIPYIGQYIVEWIWGGFSVTNPTLNRFFSLHYLFPFLLTGLVVIHLITLHENGSNNPLGISSKTDRTSFHKAYSAKDIHGLLFITLLFTYIVYYIPNILGHPDNYIQANELSTPSHIVPEWYFLFAYAILRSIPSKTIGAIAFLASIVILICLPWLNKSYSRTRQFQPLTKKIYWLFILTWLILTWIGGNPVEPPYLELGIIWTIIYFNLLIWLTPLTQWIERRIFWLTSQQQN